MASSRKTLQPDLSARVEACLARHILPATPARICLGFSGGLDSTVLLHLLTNLRPRSAFELFAVHVHHGLSPYADDWAEFACQAARALEVECTVAHVAVNRRAELGLEAAARAARYAVFERQHCDALLLAQHRDDQAETVLLNLLRGSGVRGLAAMPECRQLENGAQVLRPLLDIPRSELLAYAQIHGLRWVEDESNADQSLDRNFLRHAVFPQLQAVFPGVHATLARTAEHLAEADTILGDLARTDLQYCLKDEGFDLAAAACLSSARMRNALRYWLNSSGVVPDARAFDALLSMMCESRLDAMPVWVWREHAVRRFQHRLYLTPASIRIGAPVEFEWQGRAVMPVSAWGGTLRWNKVSEGVGIAERFLAGRLALRARRGGEGLRLLAGGPTRSLKHLYQEAGVPPWLRERTPLLWIDDRLAAVPGLWIAAEFLEQGGWQASWHQSAG